MKRKAWVSAAAPALLVLCACKCPPNVALEPAVLVNPSDQDRMELSRVVAKALNRRSVLLAPDALTVESTLIVEPVRARDAGGLPLTGRELGRPEQFELAKAGSCCFLMQQRTGERWQMRQICRVRKDL
jgi:hypothetical protein